MKLKICLAVAVMFALSILNGFGQVNTNPFQEGSAIIVSGTVANAKAGVIVTVVIPKMGITVEDLKTKPLKDAVNYINQTTTTAGGAYRFEILLADSVADNQILIRIGENNFTPALEATVNYIPTARIIAAVQAINSAYTSGASAQQNRDKMALALSSDMLGLETTGALSDYQALVSKNIVLDYMIEKVKNTPLPTATDAELKSAVSGIREYFKISTGVAVIDTCGTVSAMDSAINRYATALGLDVAEYNALDGGNFGTDKTFVCTAMFSISVANEANVQKAFKASMAVLKLNKTISWEQVKNTLQSNAVDIGIEMASGSRFNKIVNKDNFYKQYADKIPFSGVQDAVSLFNSTVESVIIAESAPISSGGGGSGGSKKPVVDTVVPVQTPQTPKPSANKQFDDLAGVPWAVEAIEALSQQGIVNGVSANEFVPDKPVTRAEFLKMVMGAFTLSNADENVTFTDISKEDWYYSYVAGASKFGIVSGNADGTFAPNDNILRQDMAVILANALRHTTINLPQTQNVKFQDEKEIDDYARQSVYQLAFAGALNGKGENYFAPKDSATRAEAAKMIYNLRR